MLSNGTTGGSSALSQGRDVTLDGLGVHASPECFVVGDVVFDVAVVLEVEGGSPPFGSEARRVVRLRARRRS